MATVPTRPSNGCGTTRARTTSRCVRWPGSSCLARSTCLGARSHLRRGHSSAEVCARSRRRWMPPVTTSRTAAPGCSTRPDPQIGDVCGYARIRRIPGLELAARPSPTAGYGDDRPVDLPQKRDLMTDGGSLRQDPPTRHPMAAGGPGTSGSSPPSSPARRCRRTTSTGRGCRGAGSRDAEPGHPCHRRPGLGEDAARGVVGRPGQPHAARSPG